LAPKSDSVVGAIGHGVAAGGATTKTGALDVTVAALALVVVVPAGALTGWLLVLKRARRFAELGGFSVVADGVMVVVVGVTTTPGEFEVTVGMLAEAGAVAASPEAGLLLLLRIARKSVEPGGSPVVSEVPVLRRIAGGVYVRRVTALNVGMT
jgi:hypothetical protein